MALQLTLHARDGHAEAGQNVRRRRIAQLRAAVADLRAANVRATEALDTALANIAAREAEWPERERRAIEEGHALAAEILRNNDAITQSW